MATKTTGIRLSDLVRPRRLRATHRPLHARMPPATPPEDRPLPELGDEELVLLLMIGARGTMPVDDQQRAIAWRLHNEQLVRLDPPAPSPFESRVAWRRSSAPKLPWSATILPRGRRLLQVLEHEHIKALGGREG
jgi:hypothetical protein